MICTNIQPVDLSKYQMPKRNPEFEIGFELEPFEATERNEGNTGCNWVDFHDFDNNLKRILESDEIVLPSSKAKLIIDYPLETVALALIEATNGFAFTRIDLARGIFEAYTRIYETEDASSDVDVIPPGERQGMLNRNATAGTFGIWGHDLDDLAIQLIQVYMIDQSYVLALEMQS